jgi:hypothetical protein
MTRILFIVSAVVSLLATVRFLVWPVDVSPEGFPIEEHEKPRWNILYHLGGNGPWIPKIDGVVKGGIDVPEGCEVQQIHMVRFSL